MMKWMLRLLGLGLLVLGGLGFALAYHARTITTEPLDLSEPQLYSVERGATLRSVLRDWQARGWWDDAALSEDIVVAAMRLQGLDARLQAGEYRLRPGRNVLQVIEQVVAGRTHEYALTIIEGWTFADMRRAIAQAEALRHVAGDLSDAELMARLGYEGTHPEGRFLPETYHYRRGETDLDLIGRAARALDSELRASWRSRQDGLPLQSADELLILASIVEKETAVPDERAQIAGVFVNRLRKRMRLQTDPTVIYGLGDAYAGDITFKHLRTDTPYNTYTRSGLPPTPIALPSPDSLRAAADPAATDALYFVATGDGRHVFSATLEAHNRAVNRYQRGRR